MFGHSQLPFCNMLLVFQIFRFIVYEQTSAQIKVKTKATNSLRLIAFEVVTM